MVEFLPQYFGQLKQIDPSLVSWQFADTIESNGIADSFKPENGSCNP